METFLLRSLVFFRVGKILRRKTKGFYPAPIKALRVIKKTFRSSLLKSLQVEKEAFLEVFFSSESRNLIRLFFLKTQAGRTEDFFPETESFLRQPGQKVSGDSVLMKKKKDAVVYGSGLSVEGGWEEIPAKAEMTAMGRDSSNLQSSNRKRTLLGKKDPKKTSGKPLIDSWKVGVLGAGVMGGGMARLLADKGQSVRLRDLRPAALSSVAKQADEFWAEQFSRGKIKQGEWRKKKDHFSLTRNLSGFSQMDIVIEALPEDKALKKQALKELGSHLTPDQIVASNTSSLNIGDLASACPCPGRVVGMHFFNPVHKMPLVEIVRTNQSDDSAVSRIFRLAKQLGKIPVIVKDRPGFIVNRLLMPYLSEALWLFMEGYNIKEVDHCFTHGFGFPLGPFRLMDEVGLDLCLKVMRSFEAAGLSVFFPTTGERVLQDLGSGRKQGSGFYRYGRKSLTISKEAFSFQNPGLKLHSTECIHRGLYRLINEALRIREEGVAPEEDIDLAGVLGMGFPPFLGGPLKYARDRGLSVIEQDLQDFSHRLGPRFAPDPAVFK